MKPAPIEVEFEVEFAESAQDDMLDILEWYSSQLVPELGLRMVAAVIEHVEQRDAGALGGQAQRAG